MMLCYAAEAELQEESVADIKAVLGRSRSGQRPRVGCRADPPCIGSMADATARMKSWSRGKLTRVGSRLRGAVRRGCRARGQRREPEVGVGAGPRWEASRAGGSIPTFRSRLALSGPILPFGAGGQRHPVAWTLRNAEVTLLAARHVGEEVGRRPVDELDEEAIAERADHVD